jgi:general stress protein 26
MATAPDQPRTDDEPRHRARLQAILDDTDTVMMITRSVDGSLHARPMAVAKLDDDGTMFFATQIDSGKIDELARDPHVTIVFQSRSRYASVSGRASVDRDPALIDELWTDGWKVWFPDGKSDPDIALVVLSPERGEYWDHSGMRGLSFLFRTAKAFVTGSHVEPGKEDHARVRM